MCGGSGAGPVPVLPPAGELLSRTVALQPYAMGEEPPLHIQPPCDGEQLPLNSINSAIPACDVQQCSSNRGTKVPVENVSKGRCNRGQMGNMTGLAQATHSNVRDDCKQDSNKSHRKKTLMGLLFKSSKNKKDRKKNFDDINKENHEMLAFGCDDDDLGLGYGFSRFNPRSRSFGIEDAAPNKLPGQQRYGSCRVNQAWQGNPPTDPLGRSGKQDCNAINGFVKSTSCRIPSVQLTGSESIRRMQEQNSSNQLLTAQHIAAGAAEPDGDTPAPASPRRQLEAILRQLQDGHT